MTRSSPLPTDPCEAAAYWFARVHSGAFSDAERQAFEQWLKGDARHAAEYHALDDIWQSSLLMDDAELRALMQTDAEALGSSQRLASLKDETDFSPWAERDRRTSDKQPPVPGALLSHRRRWLGGGLALGIVLAAAAGAIFWSSTSLVYRAAFTTAANEQRTETLPDGSVLALNVDTKVVLHYYEDARRIELLQGEAMFTVTPNAQQVFEVEADGVTARVTGTEFAVRREAKRIGVAVQSGSVEVASGPWWHRQRVSLRANQHVQVLPGEALEQQTADVAAMTAWRQGKVVFKDQALEDVVHEMNRYVAHPIHLADSRLRRLSLSGVFNVRDANAFLRALQDTLPVTVVFRADGGADVSMLR